MSWKISGIIYKTILGHQESWQGFNKKYMPLLGKGNSEMVGGSGHKQPVPKA